MTLSECYEEMGADLHEVLRRLKTEERIGKFLKLILTDTNYESLCKALEEKNYEQAFTHIHNLKGLAMNLGLTPLLVPAQELCEELRDGEPERELNRFWMRWRRHIRKSLVLSKDLTEITV